MKQFLFRFINRLGNSLSYRQSRFVLNTLGMGKLVGRLAHDQYVEIELPNGSSLTINPLLHATLESNGQLAYENDVLETIEKHLTHGGVFYDVGANVGVFSFLAATFVGDTGEVFSFEPEENNLECFRRTLAREGLKNISLFDCALGSENGHMTFDRSGGAFSGHLAKSENDAGGEAVKVEVRTIDSMVESGMTPPALVKIDVEGGEGAVLEGMRQTLEVHQPLVLCEMHHFAPDGVGRAFAALAESGYTCLTLDGEVISAAPAAPDSASQKVWQDSFHVLASPA
jgi:FkbM family methyltransferase